MSKLVKQEKTKHPGVYKRGDSYFVRYRANGKRHGVSCSTLKEALEIKRSRETARDRGEHDLVTEGKVPFADYAREWIGRYQGNGRRGFTEPTREEYRRDLERYILPRIGRMKLSAVRHRDIADLVAWLCDSKAQGQRQDDELKAAGKEPTGELVVLSDATVRRIVVPARASFATARREGLRRDNPCDDVPLPRREEIDEDEEESAKAMTRSELAMFLRLAPTEHRLMFRLLAATGVRWSELAAIQKDDFRLTGSTPYLWIRRALEKKQPKEGPPKLKAPKSRHGKRKIPLDGTLAREVRQYLAKHEIDRADQLVFTASNGRPMRQENVRRRVLQPTAEEAGVSWIGFHTFRHTCASMLFAADRNIKQIQRWLGHHSPAFTLATYVHLMDDGVGEGIDLGLELESKVSPGSAGLDLTVPDSIPGGPLGQAVLPTLPIAA